MIDLKQKVSDNFTLEEFIKSETAMKNGFTEQYQITEEIKNNIIKIAVNICEPIRIKFGSFTPTCCYRCLRVNSKVGGAKNSEHLKAKAIDETFIKNGVNISKEVFIWCITGGLKKWSKIILEFPDKNGVPNWLHIGYDENKLYNQVLVAQKNIFGKTEYINFYGSKYEKQILNK